MTNKTISALTAATLPLAGTELVPTWDGTNTVKTVVNDLTVRNYRAAGTTGIMRLAGPLAGATWTMTVPNANWTAARTDASNTFNGNQTISAGNLLVSGTDAVYAQGGGANANPNAGAETSYLGCNFVWRVANPAGSTNIWEAQLVQPTGAYVDNGDLVWKRLGVIKIRYSAAGISVTDNIIPVTSGKGINFTANTPAAGMTSQLLNWYEEGTFTPVLTSSGGGVPTYDFRTGKYTRIGNTVHYFIEIYLTSLNTLAAGNLDITGLPFNASGYQTCIADYSGFGSSLLSVFARSNPSASNLTLYYQAATATNFGVALTQGNLAATSGMRISGTYFI
jgi:hypothetical protein